ncbi:unnamed protein product [Effrenium voratum]|nr:unnamed protein product [Effrenium voratum]
MAPAHWPSTLERLDLRGARCNDGSPGAMYFTPPLGFTKGSVWHIHLEGGGYCYDEESCSSVEHGPKLRSSWRWPNTKTLGGLFARGPGATPQLKQAAHAFVGYCSSDSWVGNTSVEWSGQTWYFQGAQILLQAVQHLLKLGMDRASLVFFSGCSAGGRGVLYNLDGLCRLLHSAAPNARCAGLGDAAWWLESVHVGSNTWPSALQHVTQQGSQLWRSSSLALALRRCQGAAPDSGFQCFFGPALGMHLEMPVLLAQQLNDYFQFDHLVKSHHTLYIGGPMGGPVSRQDLEVMAGLRSGLKHSLQRWAQEAERPVFASSCFGHCITEGASYFDIRLQEGPGQGWSLNDTTSAFLDSLGSSGFSEAFIEQCTCKTLLCSSGCPPRELWQVLLEVLAGCFLLPMLALCILRRMCCRSAPKATAPDSERLALTQ